MKRAGEQVDELLAALAMVSLPCVFTLPNADTSGREVRSRILDFVERTKTARAVESLGTQGYFSLMAAAAAMLGNSSSGLLEAPSFKLPVVNVGSRQRGRIRAANVIDCEPNREEIGEALVRALDPAFRGSLAGLSNPYGDGRAAGRIVDRLRGVPLDDSLILKRFRDLAPVRGS